MDADSLGSKHQPSPPKAIHGTVYFPTLNSREKTGVAMLVYLILGGRVVRCLFQVVPMGQKAQPQEAQLGKRWHCCGLRAGPEENTCPSATLDTGGLQKGLFSEADSKPPWRRTKLWRCILTHGRGGPCFKRPNVSVLVPPRQTSYKG